MAHDRIHWMRTLFQPAATVQRGECWQPPVDVYRTADGWLIKCDLAGVRPADVTLSCRGNRVKIQGIRRDCCIEEGLCHYRLEIAYNRFERTIELPDDLERATLASEFRQGMLLIRIRTEGMP